MSVTRGDVGGRTKDWMAISAQAATMKWRPSTFRREAMCRKSPASMDNLDHFRYWRAKRLPENPRPDAADYILKPSVRGWTTQPVDAFDSFAGKLR